MFCDDLNSVQELPKLVTNTRKRRKLRKKTKSESFDELMHRLFGSDLEDIELIEHPKVKKIKRHRRRRSLPVSINIADQELLPLKLQQKRRSEADAVLTSRCKLTKKEPVVATISELTRCEFMVASLLVKQDTNVTESAIETVVCNELMIVTVMDKPVINQAIQERVKVSSMQQKNNDVIDLTEDENMGVVSTGLGKVLEDTSALLKKELSELLFSSENANAPAPGVSMPLISPVSPAVPTYVEPTLPETTNTPCVTNVTINPSGQIQIQRLQNTLTQRPPPPAPCQTMPPPPTTNQGVKRSHPDSGKRLTELQKRLLTKVPFSNSNMVGATVPQSSQQIHKQIGPSNQLQSVPNSVSNTVSHQNQQQIPVAAPQWQQRQLQTMQQPLLQRAGYSGNQPQNSNITTALPIVPSTQAAQGPQAPQLIRLSARPEQNRKYINISNVALGQKLVPHVIMFMRWKENVNRYVLETKSILPSKDFQEDIQIFSLYTDRILEKFGRAIIREISMVEVDELNLLEVCNTISLDLYRDNYQSKVYRVLGHIYLMIRSYQKYCETPFMKIFYYHVKKCIDQMERKTNTQEPVLFTLSQIKQLETQIYQYRSIAMWIDIMRKGTADLRVPQSTRLRQVRQTKTSHTSSKKQKPGSVIASNPDSVPASVSCSVAASVSSSAATSVPCSVGSSIQQGYLRDSLQQTILNSYMQHCVADRSGKDNHPARPVITNSDNQQSSLNKTQTSQTVIPETRNVPEQPLQPEPVPSSEQSNVSVESVPSESTKRQEGSVIVYQQAASEQYRPSENTEIVANTTEQSNDPKVTAYIDLTWIDDGDEDQMREEIKDIKAFPLKLENEEPNEGDALRESVSPADSGLGSPHPQVDGTDGFKCLCGKQAIYVCACNASMYCGTECQINDWTDHQKLCNQMKSSS